MKKFSRKHHLILGISPSSRGFGFAVMEGDGILIDWGVKAVKSGDKNLRSLAYAKSLIIHWEPNLVAIANSKISRRGFRVKELCESIIAFALGEHIKVKQLARAEINRELLHDPRATKQSIAQYLASLFPEELGFRLPRRRRLWTSEDYPMDIFDAVALVRYAISARGEGSLCDSL
jgi:hypothetical protein